MFLLIYFSVYSAMNAYGLWTLYHSLRGGWPGWAVIAGVALLMILAPFLVHRLEMMGHLLPAQSLALAAYFWMALIFWLFWMCLAKDLWNAGFALSGMIKPGLYRYRCPAPWFPRIALPLLGFLVIWGLAEAARIRLRQVTVMSDKIAPEITPLRVALIADLHLGLIARQKRVQKVVAMLEKAAPDLILSVGDLIDSGGPHMTGLLLPYQTLTPRLGKYAVLGNHEFYGGIARCQDLLTREAGFTVLRNQAACPCPGLRILGVDDPAVHGQRPAQEQDDEDALISGSLVTGDFSILLKHRPEFSALARRQVSLQLSGHTHKGQIFPFFCIVRQLYPVPHGQLISWPEGLLAYVSPGTGTWGPPLRVLARPEITLLEIRRSKQE